MLTHNSVSVSDVEGGATLDLGTVDATHTFTYSYTYSCPNAHEVGLTTAEIRVCEVLMAGGQLLLDRSGVVADPYLTIVGYFNATCELADMARYMGDDVQTALAKGHPWSRLLRRTGTGFGQLDVAELISWVYHETFYARVEALSVTPFSATSLDRGLDGVLVSAVRVLQAARGTGCRPNTAQAGSRTSGTSS